MLMRSLIWHHTSLFACGGMLASAELWQAIMLVYLLAQATHVTWWLVQPIVPHHHQPLRVPQMESRVQLEALKCKHGCKVPLLKLATMLKEVLQHQILCINTGTFPGTPAVRFIGDCHSLHRLCQLLLFYLIFRRRQAPRLIGGAQKNPTDSLQKRQTVQTGQMVLGTKRVEEGKQGRPMRLGSGNVGQGYTSEVVKVLFIILVDLCRKSAGLPHTLRTSEVGIDNLNICLPYISGNYIVVPEVVEGSLGPHIQNMPRLRVADAAGLLLHELELQPPSDTGKIYLVDP